MEKAAELTALTASQKAVFNIQYLHSYLKDICKLERNIYIISHVDTVDCSSKTARLPAAPRKGLH